MDFSVLIFPVWLLLVFWVYLSGSLGLSTKKERLCALVIIDVIAVIVSVSSFFESRHIYSHVFWAIISFINMKATKDNYRKWKNTDDDDEWKHRRMSWVKSHLPKPTTRAIPQPV